jgi:hypothetical protein
MHSTETVKQTLYEKAAAMQSRIKIVKYYYVGGI